MKNTFSYNKVSNKEAGVVLVLLALILPVLFFIVSLVWAVQYTEGIRREDQSIVDSASVDAAIALDSTKWGYNMALIKALESVKTQVGLNRNDTIIQELNESIQMLKDWMNDPTQLSGVNAEPIYQGHVRYIEPGSPNLQSFISPSEFCFGRNGNNGCELTVQIQRGRYWPESVVSRWNQNNALTPIPLANFIYSNVTEHNQTDFYNQRQVASNVDALRRFEPFEAISDDKIGATFANSSWSTGAFSLGTPNFVAANAVRVVVRRRLNLWMTLASFFRESQDNDFQINEEALAVGGNVGEDTQESMVRVAPFAIPACALIDPSGDYNPAYSCHLDRYFTQEDRFSNDVNQDPIPGAFWGPLTESEYCDSPIDNTPLDSNRLAMCSCALSPNDGRDDVPCSDANGSSSVSCTFNAWQSHAKASNYYGVIGVPESSGIHQALQDVGLDENERMVYQQIFSCTDTERNIDRSHLNGQTTPETNLERIRQALTLKGISTNDYGVMLSLRDINLSGGTVDAQIGDRFFIADQWGQGAFANNLIAGDALWDRINGNCGECSDGTFCSHGMQNYEMEYPFHNPGRNRYSDPDLFMRNGVLTGSAHKELGFWYTLGRVHDKLGYPQRFGIQASPLFSLYEAVGSGRVGKDVTVNGRNVPIEYNQSNIPAIDDWRIDPNACNGAPQYGTCGSRRIRYDTLDKKEATHINKYMTPAAKPNYDPKVDPEKWTLYPGRLDGFEKNRWGGVGDLPKKDRFGGEWNEPLDRQGGNWPTGGAPLQEKIDGIKTVYCTSQTCENCKNQHCENGYVWNNTKFANAYEAYDACQQYVRNNCQSDPRYCENVSCNTKSCTCEQNTQRENADVNTAIAYCNRLYANVCIGSEVSDKREEFWKTKCDEDKKRAQDQCAREHAAQECGIGNKYQDHFSEECLSEHDDKCGSCPSDDPDCHDAEEKAWCQACTSEAITNCISEEASNFLESDQCKITDDICDGLENDNENNLEGFLPEQCDGGSKQGEYETYLEEQLRSCIESAKKGDIDCLYIRQAQNDRCRNICNSCQDILEKGLCCYSKTENLYCDSEREQDEYWPSDDSWRTSTKPIQPAYAPYYPDYGYCGQKFKVDGWGFSASVGVAEKSMLSEAVYMPACRDFDKDTGNDADYAACMTEGQSAMVSEFTCPFMPQYMPYARSNEYTTDPSDTYTPNNSRVWRVAIPVIADTNQQVACNLVESDSPLNDRTVHPNPNWIVIGFVETVIFDTDIGLDVQHAPGLSYSENGGAPYTCDYEQGYAIKAKAGAKLVDGELQADWVDLRRGREPWQFTPDFETHDSSDPMDDTGTPVACNMVRARISCESQLLASRDFSRNAVRRARIISK